MGDLLLWGYSEIIVGHWLILLANLVRSLVENECVVAHVLIQFEDSSIIAHTIRVVWSAKHCADLVTMGPVKPSLRHLMSATDVLKTIPVIKVAGYVLAKKIASTARALLPAVSLTRFIWITPQ